MGRPYTFGSWRVKAGREEEFVAAWQEFADWTATQGLASKAQLLRDHEDPSLFVSLGPWESLDTIARWRSLPGFHDRIVALHALLDSFEPRTLELVAEK